MKVKIAQALQVLEEIEAEVDELMENFYDLSRDEIMEILEKLKELL